MVSPGTSFFQDLNTASDRYLDVEMEPDEESTGADA